LCHYPFSREYAASPYTRPFKGRSYLYFGCTGYRVVGQDDVVCCEALGRKRTRLPKLVRKHRDGEVLGGLGSELALYGGFSGSGISTFPAADESAVSSCIVIWQERLNRSPQAFFGDSDADILEGLPPEAMKTIGGGARHDGLGQEHHGR
jgi:hypothetical protein